MNVWIDSRIGSLTENELGQDVAPEDLQDRIAVVAAVGANCPYRLRRIGEHRAQHHAAQLQARPKCSSSATATKQRTWLISNMRSPLEAVADTQVVAGIAGARLGIVGHSVACAVPVIDMAVGGIQAGAL
jgi:hypothetical protein